MHSAAFDKFYIGQTNDVDDRLARHNAGTEKATHPYRPWKLAWFTQKASRAEAMQLEKKLKNLSKARIRKFITRHSSQDDQAGSDAAVGRSEC